MNQYVVDSDDQTSGFGAYSLSFMGPELQGLPAPGDVFPGRFLTHCINSSPGMVRYASRGNVPASAGKTQLKLRADTLVALTTSDGVPVIRTTVEVGPPAGVLRGQLRYFTLLQSARFTPRC